jgi:rhodanese-related sulfurtransferase
MPSARARLDSDRLRRWRREDSPPRILDVRSPAEFGSLHIPGSYNVPLDTLQEHRDELSRHLEQDVVLVCRSGFRAEQAERALAEAGMPDVHVLEGGIDAWQRSGGEVTRGRQQWSLERQVRLVAGLLVLTGVLASLAVPAAVWFAGAIGAGLTVAALTDTCALGALLARMPHNRGTSCDIDSVVAELTHGRSRS